MQYLLLIHGQEVNPNQHPTPEGRKMMEAFQAYTKALIDSGTYVGGNALHPASSGTVVKVRDGKTQVLDGPYADTKEQLGGYYLIDVPDLDKALEWAARCPGAAAGAMEVRPIVVFS
jgi:hypothetical protein